MNPSLSPYAVFTFVHKYVPHLSQITQMDQTLNRIAESLTFLLDQRVVAEGEGGGRSRPRLRRTFVVVPSHDSLPSYDQLSSSPSSFSSNPAACPNPPLSSTASQEESC